MGLGSAWEGPLGGGTPLLEDVRELLDRERAALGAALAARELELAELRAHLASLGATAGDVGWHARMGGGGGPPRPPTVRDLMRLDVRAACAGRWRADGADGAAADAHVIDLSHGRVAPATLPATVHCLRWITGLTSVCLRAAGLSDADAPIVCACRGPCARAADPLGAPPPPCRRRHGGRAAARALH